MAAALISFGLATIDPYFLNMFWQIPDGAEILRGHLPTTVSYAIASGPLVSQEWLYEAALAWAVQHEAFGAFALFCGAAAAATPLLVYALARTCGVGDVAAGITGFLIVGARFAASATRPETFAVDAFALELILLVGTRSVFWIVPTVVLWANLHASVVLAPLAALLFGLAEGVATRKVGGVVRRSFAIAGLAFAASFVTPHGVKLWAYAFDLAIAPSPVRQHLDVWKPLSFGAPGAVTALLPGILILMCCGIVLRRRYAGEIAIAALCFALTLMHARYALFLVVAWSPAIARTLAARIGLATPSQPSAAASGRSWATLFALIPLFFYACSHGVMTFRAPAAPPGPWQAAAGIIADHHLQGNAYAPYVWAAYLHWRALPVRLLIDAHGDPYSKDVWADHLALEQVRPNWRDVLERRHIAVVVVPVDTPLAQVMRLNTAWRTVEVRDNIVAYALRLR